MTPTDAIPLFGAIATITGISVKIGKILQKLDTMAKDVADIKVEVKEHDRCITTLEAKRE